MLLYQISFSYFCFQMDLRFPNIKKLLLENINDTAESKSLTIPQNNQLPDLSPHFSTPH